MQADVHDLVSKLFLTLCRRVDHSDNFDDTLHRLFVQHVQVTIELLKHLMALHKYWLLPNGDVFVRLKLLINVLWDDLIVTDFIKFLFRLSLAQVIVILLLLGQIHYHRLQLLHSRLCL